MKQRNQAGIEVKGWWTTCGNKLTSFRQCTHRDHLKRGMEGEVALKRRSMAGGQQRFVRTPSSLSRTNFWKNSCSLHFLPSFPSPFFLVQRRWRSDVWKEAKLEIHSFHSAIRLLRSPAMHAATQSTFKKDAPQKRERPRPSVRLSEVEICVESVSRSERKGSPLPGIDPSAIPLHHHHDDGHGRS